MGEKEIPRLSRLTAILTQLQSKRILTAKLLAEKYDVSVRTIYRDIRTLEKSGVPIVTEEGKGYSLMQGYQVPPVMFTENEANALITAEQLIRKNKDRSLVENYNNAITKIKSVLKYSQKEKTDLLSERIIFRINLENQTTSSYLMTIQSAITNHRFLEIEYCSLQKELTKRIIEPFALYSTQENWLLIAFCKLRNEFRVFRIDQIQKLIIRNENFTPHDMTLEKYFELCKKNQGTPDMPLS
jgi:predicted DNA-binding transcriptional regulator YafY